MTRFVVYDAEVASRLAQAVGVHRVELRDVPPFANKINPALMEAIGSDAPSAVLMPSSDEQVLVVRMRHTAGEEVSRAKKRKKGSNSKQKREEPEELGSRPSGFLGLHDEVAFPDDEEDPPRSLWKKESES
jgi:hypothetical protein